MIDIVRPIPIANQTEQVSSKQGHDLLFEQYELEKLQHAICISFYYNEFMENVKQLFQESHSSSTLNINEQCSLFMIYNSINNLLTRLKP